MFLINSRLQSFAEGLFLPKETRPYPEVTAAVLPSSLTMFHSYALVHLHPPTCVGFGTGTIVLTLEAFLGPLSFPLPYRSRVAMTQGIVIDGFSYQSTPSPQCHSHRTQETLVSVPPLEHYRGAGILTCCASTTPFGLALAPD